METATFEIKLVPQVTDLHNVSMPLITLPADIEQQAVDVINNIDDYEMIMTGTADHYEQFQKTIEDDYTVTLRFTNAQVDTTNIGDDQTLESYLFNDINASLSDGWGENSRPFGPISLFSEALNEHLQDDDPRIQTYPNRLVIRDPNNNTRYPPAMDISHLNPEWVRIVERRIRFWAPSLPGSASAVTSSTVHGRLGNYFRFTDTDDRVHVPDDEVMEFDSFQYYYNPYTQNTYVPGTVPPVVPADMIESIEGEIQSIADPDGGFEILNRYERYYLSFNLQAVQIL